MLCGAAKIIPFVNFPPLADITLLRELCVEAQIISLENDNSRSFGKFKKPIVHLKPRFEMNSPTENPKVILKRTPVTL